MIGWLLARGVARCCGAKLPASYVMFEIMGSILVGLVGLFAGLWAVGAVVVVWGLVTYGAALAKRSSLVRDSLGSESDDVDGMGPQADVPRSDS